MNSLDTLKQAAQVLTDDECCRAISAVHLDFDEISTRESAINVARAIEQAVLVKMVEHDAQVRDAARFACDVLAELYAKYQTRIGPFASQAQLANVRLRAALKTTGGQDAQ